MTKNSKSSLKHPILVFILCLCMCIALIGSISAYYITKSSKNNEISIGYVESEIIEDFNPPKELKPGITFKKDVKIKNTGPNDCYVRVLVNFSNSEVGDYCTLNYNTNDWTFNSNDGYWYYNSILKSGKTTSSLFTTVKVDDGVNENDLKDFDITIYHESSSIEFNKK